MTNAYEKGKLYELPIGDLVPDANQPRKSMDPQALEELTASVKNLGIIQPLLFRVDMAGTPSGSPQGSEGVPGNLILVAGERRFRAAQDAGLATVPGICIEGNPSEIALVENLLRQDLTSVEEAEALQRLKEEQQYTDEQLSGVIGKARTTISDILLINRLPVEVRDECRGDRKIAKSVLIDIARKKQARGMVTAYNAYKAKQEKGKTTRQKTDPNAPDNLFALVDKTLVRLNALDMTSWSEDDRINFQTLVATLKQWIDTFQAPPAQAPE